LLEYSALCNLIAPQTLGLSLCKCNTLGIICSRADIQAMYKACSYDVATFELTSQFCALFSQNDIEMFEYAEDLENYYLKGHGTPLAYEISCPLLTDFIEVRVRFLASEDDKDF
jgi:hypothetical protein